MKKIRMILYTIMISILLASCGSSKANEKFIGNENAENKIIEYGDYKCPYCKEVEENIMPKIKKDYIDKHKANYQYVNMAFLGDDSLLGSKAGHAVQNIAPNEYLDFQESIFKKQPDSEKEWITESLLDDEIKNLNINNKKKEKIIKEYKEKNSKAWKDAEKDKKLYKKNDIKEAPTVYVNGERVDNPYKYSEYKKLMK